MYTDKILKLEENMGAFYSSIGSLFTVSFYVLSAHP
jgi:hypothetical protein